MMQLGILTATPVQVKRSCLCLSNADLDLTSWCAQGLAGSVGRYVSFMREATAGYAQEAALAAALATAAIDASLCAHAPARPLDAPVLVHTHFTSLCEHHLLPFQGQVRVALCPLPGLAQSALQRLVLQLISCYTRRLQVQERITHQVADGLAALAMQGCVLVVCDAVHMCMVARGVEQHASATLTTAARGLFASDVALRSRVLEQLLTLQQV